MLKVSVSGIRGLWGEDLTPESVFCYTRAFACYLIKQHKYVTNLTVVIGSDTRPTSPVLKSMVCSFLQTFGIHIIDLGVLATPITLYAVRKHNAQGGISITASHNPIQWNALKLINSEGLFFNVEQMKAIDHLAKYPLPIEMSYHQIGALAYDDTIASTYIQKTLPYFQIEPIKNSGIKVSADLINGTAVDFFPTLMESLGLEYYCIHKDKQKAFERVAEPKPENLSALSAYIIQTQSHIGFAFDPDGDRLALLDENGIAVGENWTLVIAYLCFLKYHTPYNKDIAINLSTSLLIDQVAKQFNATVWRTPVGEINVTDKILKEKLQIGGEGNGGVIFPELNPCRDSIIAILFVLEYLALEKTTLSAIIKQFPTPYIINTYITVHNTPHILDFKEKLIFLMTDIGLNHITIDIQDGLRASYSDGWIQLRSSNTEPIIRIMGESYNNEIQNQLTKTIISWF